MHKSVLLSENAVVNGCITFTKVGIGYNGTVVLSIVVGIGYIHIYSGYFYSGNYSRQIFERGFVVFSKKMSQEKVSVFIIIVGPEINFSG